jgi:hypothetical protein
MTPQWSVVSGQRPVVSGQWSVALDRPDQVPEASRPDTQEIESTVFVEQLRDVGTEPGECLVTKRRGLPRLSFTLS